MGGIAPLALAIHSIGIRAELSVTYQVSYVKIFC
jgi:hypothetical protein